MTPRSLQFKTNCYINKQRQHGSFNRIRQVALRATRLIHTVVPWVNRLYLISIGFAVFAGLTVMTNRPHHVQYRPPVATTRIYVLRSCDDGEKFSALQRLPMQLVVDIIQFLFSCRCLPKLFQDQQRIFGTE